MIVVAAWLPVTVVFGRELHGAPARLLFAVTTLIYLLCAYGYYKRDLRGWVLSLAYYAFCLVSGVITSSRLNLAEMYQQLGLPAPNAATLDLIRRLMPLGYVLLLIYIILVIYSRRYFVSNAPASPASLSPQTSISS